MMLYTHIKMNLDTDLMPLTKINSKQIKPKFNLNNKEENRGEMPDNSDFSDTK